MENIPQHVKLISDKITTYPLIHKGKRITPMHVALSEAIHKTC